MNGSMDGYFKMFKEMIGILSKHEQTQQDDNWKCFTKSTIVDKSLLVNVEKKINNPSNTSDIVDDKWCSLLKTMIDSFDDETLLNKYDDPDDLDCKTNDELHEDDNSGRFFCNKNHSMIKIQSQTDTHPKQQKCVYCNNLHNMTSLSLECAKCQEYICTTCINNVIEFIRMLEKQQFDTFSSKLGTFTQIHQENMIKTVELVICVCVVCF